MFETKAEFHAQLNHKEIEIAETENYNLKKKQEK